MLQPSILAFGGGVANEKENLIAPLRKLVDKEVYCRKEEDRTELKSATLGNDAGIIGAAALR